MTYRLSTILALPLLFATGSLATLPATPALALPRYDTCVITIYYNDSAHDEVVGKRTHCTGSPTESTGRTSPYSETIRVVADTPHPHPGGGGGSLPCEFLEGGCPIFAPGHGAPAL
jgi:hypothetical protein